MNSLLTKNKPFFWDGLLLGRLEELEAYFRVGGFPMAVAEGGPKAVRPAKAMATYWSGLAGDTAKLGKQEPLLREIMIQIAVCLQTPFSFQTLAKKTSIGSHNTVQEYVSILESCFALKTLYAIDPETARRAKLISSCPGNGPSK